MIRKLIGIVFFSTLLLLGACSKRVELLTVPSQSEANDIAVALNRFGVPGAEIQASSRGRESSFTLLVTPKQLERAREIVATLGLPKSAFNRPKRHDSTSGFGKSSEIAARKQVRDATMEDIADSLRIIPRIKDVRVTLTVDDPGLTASSTYRRRPVKNGDESTRPRATVALVWVATSEKDTPPISEADLRARVANGFVGLDADRVNVAMNRVVLPQSEPIPVDTESFDTTAILFASTAFFAILSGVFFALILRQRSREKKSARKKAPSTGSKSNERDAA